MEPYTVYLVALAFLNIALAYHRYNAQNQEKVEESLVLPKDENKIAATKFKWEYFSLYSLVMAADWLQGPYMYTLYKDEKDISELTVAALFMTGFVVAGITASFVGTLADRHGRKAGCMTYCITYSLSCLSVLSNDLFILFVGRALGGLSTTLQYSMFETWMIAEYHKRDLRSCLSLGSMFSLSVSLSGVVAILAGIIGETIVERSGTKTSPFIAAFVCLASAFIGIHQVWSENYGEVTAEKKQAGEGIQMKLLDPRVLALGTTTTLFEGSMYLFVFFWSPAIISSRTLDNNNDPPPFGIIFSCFMCAMMLGSMIFSAVKPGTARDAAKLMLVTLSLASYALFGTGSSKDGSRHLLVFCLI